MTENILSPCLMLVVTDMGTEKKMERLIFEVHLPVYCQCRGHGTANSELLDVCGLSGKTRLVTAIVLPRSMVKPFFQRLRKEFSIDRKGTGIAASIRMLGMQETVMKALNEETRIELEKTIGRTENRMNQETSYTMVMAAVREGYSDEVIDAAASAGGKGGTVIRGRRRGSENIVQFLGISMQEEQEFVMLIVPREKKTEIMKKVNDACGLKTPAQGIILSVPVEDVIGIEG